METTLRDLEREASWQLQRLSRIRPSQDMMPEGITPSEMLALKIASDFLERGEIPRPGVLASHMHVTKPALSQTLRSLEEKGLVLRQRDKRDSRSVLLEVTELGRAKLAEADAMRTEDAHRLVEYIGVQDMAYLVALLDKVATFMEARGAVAGGEGPCEVEPAEAGGRPRAQGEA